MTNITLSSRPKTLKILGSNRHIDLSTFTVYSILTIIQKEQTYKTLQRA